MEAKPSQHLLGEGRPFLPDIKKALGPLPVRPGDDRLEEPKPVEPAPQLSLEDAAPPQRDEDLESNAPSDLSLGDSSSSSASSLDATEDWTSDLDWFASKAKWPWRGVPLKDDPPGS